jgi:hypothetical protein
MAAASLTALEKYPDQCADLRTLRDNITALLTRIDAGEKMTVDLAYEFEKLETDSSNIFAVIVDQEQDAWRKIVEEKEAAERAAKEKRLIDAQGIAAKAEILTSKELAERVMTDNLPQVCDLATYSDFKWLTGFYYVDEDHWIRGPTWDPYEEKSIIIGCGYEYELGKETNRIYVSWGKDYWGEPQQQFIGYYDVLEAQGRIQREVLRAQREMGRKDI